jgi:hypothetical protein
MCESFIRAAHEYREAIKHFHPIKREVKDVGQLWAGKGTASVIRTSLPACKA